MDKKQISRRLMLEYSASLFSGACLVGALGSFPARSARLKLLIVSGWQDINIGDIAHTPGLLNIFKTYLPDAEIILWKRSYSKDIESMLQLNFPDVKIIYGAVDQNNDVEDKDVINAFSEADLMVHGSGPSVVGKPNLEAWVKHTGKPFGIFGVTIQTIDNNLKELLNKASFIFTRETASLKSLTSSGITTEVQYFVPDATFFLNLKNDEKALSFLSGRNLVEKKFICVVPRLRRTPYYKHNPSAYSPDQVKTIDDLNNSKKEADHSKLREAMTAWVRKTGNMVLVCPEMTYQVDIMDELLINPLPEDVKPLVLKRGYWFPDEAASIYSKAFAVISFECHSPIIAIRNNTPAFYLRQPEDTIKGQMYYDMGLSDWIFEIEQTTGEMITEELLRIYSNQEYGVSVVESCKRTAESLFRKGIKTIKQLKYD